MIVQSGNRPNDAFGKGFTHGGLAKACRSAPTIFPYELVNASKANCASDKDLRLPVGKGLLVREDPYNADPNDEEDPRNQLDDKRTRQLWECQQGRCVEVSVHQVQTFLMHNPHLE